MILASVVQIKNSAGEYLLNIRFFVSRRAVCERHKQRLYQHLEY